MKAQNEKKSEIFIKLNSLSAKSSKANGRLKTIHEAFRVEIHFKLKPIECKITYLLFIF